MMKSVLIVCLVGLILGASQAHGQAVVNWGGAAASSQQQPEQMTEAPAAPAPRGATFGASRVAQAPEVETPAAPSPTGTPAPPVAQAPAIKSAADLGQMAGYVNREGPEPTTRLDVGRVPPDLMKLYAQQPGESESAYIERMGAFYRQMQAQSQAVQQQNAAYIQSLAPKQTK